MKWRFKAKEAKKGVPNLRAAHDPGEGGPIMFLLQTMDVVICFFDIPDIEKPLVFHNRHMKGFGVALNLANM